MNIFARARHPFDPASRAFGGGGSGSTAVIEPRFDAASTGAEPQATRRTLPRVGFLGVGWIGRHRMTALAETGLVEIAAVADPVVEFTVEAGRLAPGAQRVTSLDELFALDLDAVVIATPSALHADQAVAALERGIHVFCQKPLGRNAAEVRRVIAAAREANCLLGVDLSYRFLEGAQKIHEIARAGELGKVFAVDVVFHNAYGPDKAWFYDPKLSGGGCVIDLGIHLVDLALWVLDFPRVEKVSSRLFVQGAPLRDRSRQVEDFATARIDLANDATVHLDCSWKLHAGCDARIEAAFYGTEAAAVVRNLNGSFYDFETVLCKGTSKTVLAGPPQNWGGAAAIQWAQQLAHQPHFDRSNERLIQVAEVLDAMYDA